MNVTLSPEAEQMIGEQLASGTYQTAEQAILDALQLLAKREQDRVEEMLLAGLNSPLLGEADAAFWEKLERTVEAELQKKIA